MFEKLFGKKGKSGMPLERNEVVTRVEAFLLAWEPFKRQFSAVGPMTVDADQGRWVATVTPAIDLRCVVVVTDEVDEARLVAMRTGAVVAQYRRSPQSSGHNEV